MFNKMAPIERFKKYIKEYFDNSSIHGLRFFLDIRQSFFGRYSHLVPTNVEDTY